MDLNTLKQRHEELKMKTHAEEMALKLLEEQKSKQEKELFKVQRENYDKKILKELLEKSSDEARKNGKEVLEKTATNSVQMVLGESYSVQINLDSQRGVPTADVDIVKETTKGKMVIEAMEEGGGIRDIISLSTFVSTGMLVGEGNKAPNFPDIGSGHDLRVVGLSPKSGSAPRAQSVRVCWRFSTTAAPPMSAMRAP